MRGTNPVTGLFAAVTAAVLLVGCSTAAQRQYDGMVANGQSAGQKLEACAMARYNSPDYALLRLISGSLAAFPPSTFA